jgi:hypothetical protein
MAKTVKKTAKAVVQEPEKAVQEKPHETIQEKIAEIFEPKPEVTAISEDYTVKGLECKAYSSIPGKKEPEIVSVFHAGDKLRLFGKAVDGEGKEWFQASYREGGKHTTIWIQKL